MKTHYTFLFNFFTVIILTTLIALGIWLSFLFFPTVLSYETQYAQTTQKPENLPSNFLSIPGLDINAPIIYVNEKTENTFQQALEKGVVHYPGTALPGQQGNVYIFGHSSDLPWRSGDYKYIFRDLPKINRNESIYLTDSQANKYEYKVVEKKIVNAQATEYLDSNSENPTLTLQTSYPIGTSLQRILIIAELK